VFANLSTFNAAVGQPKKTIKTVKFVESKKIKSNNYASLAIKRCFYSKTFLMLVINFSCQQPHHFDDMD
jgi:hypothetical protein